MEYSDFPIECSAAVAWLDKNVPSVVIEDPCQLDDPKELIMQIGARRLVDELVQAVNRIQAGE